MKPDPAVLNRINEILDDPDRQDEDFTAADGRTYRIRKRPAPGVKAIVEYREPDGPFHRMTELFDPAPQRPASYPEDLPYVPGVEVMVVGTILTIPPSRMVSWDGLEDAQNLARQVIEQSENEGWVPTGEPRPNPFGPMLELRRGSASRHLSARASSVSVLQTDPE